MLHVHIDDNTETAQAIKAAADDYNLDANAFASGLINALLHKKTSESTPAPAPAPAESQPSTPATR